MYRNMNPPPIYNRFFSVLVFTAAVFLVSRPSAVSASGAGETDRRGYAEEEPSEQLTPYCMQSGYTPFPDSIIYTQPENPGRGIAVPSVNKHGEVIPVAFILRRDEPGFDELRKGVETGGELLTPLGGWVELIEAAPDSGSVGIGAAVENAAERGFRGIIVPDDRGAAFSALESAVNGGICIAKYGRVSLPGRALFYIGPDHAGAGRRAADVLNSMMDGEGGAVVLYGDSADPQDSLRLGGMLGRIQELNTGISVYAVLDDRDTPAVSRARVLDCSRAYPGLSALAVLSEGCTGAVQGLRETGLRENVSLVCFDRFPGGKEMAEGAGADIFTISQDFYTQGRDSVILLYNYCVTGEHPANFYNFTKNSVTRGAEY